MIKPDRISLVGKIVRLANLPAGKETAGYLTHRQLSELSLYLEGARYLLKNMKGSQPNDAKEET